VLRALGHQALDVQLAEVVTDADVQKPYLRRQSGHSARPDLVTAAQLGGEQPLEAGPVVGGPGGAGDVVRLPFVPAQLCASPFRFAGQRTVELTAEGRTSGGHGSIIPHNRRSQRNCWPRPARRSSASRVRCSSVSGGCRLKARGGPRQETAAHNNSPQFAHQRSVDTPTRATEATPDRLGCGQPASTFAAAWFIDRLFDYRRITGAPVRLDEAAFGACGAGSESHVGCPSRAGFIDPDPRVGSDGSVPHACSSQCVRRSAERA